MDARRQQLVAAADAMRAWVNAQRAAWDNPDLYTTMPAARPAAAIAAVSEPRAVVATEPAPDLAAPEPVPAFQIREALGRLARQLSQALPVALPSWRVAMAAVLVVMTIGAARLFWPALTGTIKREVAAGRQVVETGRSVVATGRRVVDAGREVVEKGRRVVSAAGTPAPPAGAADAAAEATGALQIETDPPGATIFIDGRDRGVTPLTIDDLAPATYNVLLTAGAGSVQRKAVVRSGQTTKIIEGIFSGWLRVIAPIDVLVSEGTRGLQLDDSGQVLLAPGAHDIVIENRAFGFRELHHVSVRPGDTTTIAVELPPSTITVTATEPAEVTIDGEPAGAAPLVDHPVSIGPREVTVTGESGAVRRITVNVTREPARVEVDLARPGVPPVTLPGRQRAGGRSTPE